ncbi:SMI1/KNR4 family protein [Burkholderia contaminans]|nr:SMI1/KNR4 family protein [Burkholderia contaminans]
MTLTNSSVPPLEWPSLPDEAARLAWFRAVIEAYADLWAGHVTMPKLTPATQDAVSQAEGRIGCALPVDLRRYHLEIGTLALSEQLCALEKEAPTPILPLFMAFPGLVERGLSKQEDVLAKQMVVFSDYLGNGNMFCFHKSTGAVYYFDHDTDPVLTLFASNINSYLEALMIKMLADVHEKEEAGEDLLVERFGRALIHKWMY